MIGNNQSMRPILGRWHPWRHQSKPKATPQTWPFCLHIHMWPRFQFWLMTSGMSPAQYSPHQLIIANHEKILLFWWAENTSQTYSFAADIIHFTTSQHETLKRLSYITATRHHKMSIAIQKCNRLEFFIMQAFNYKTFGYSYLFSQTEINILW